MGGRGLDLGMQALSGTECGFYAAWCAKHGPPALSPRAWSWVGGNREKNDREIRRLVRLDETSGRATQRSTSRAADRA